MMTPSQCPRLEKFALDAILKDCKTACLLSVRASAAAESAWVDDNDAQLCCYFANLAERQAVKTRTTFQLVRRRRSEVARQAMRTFEICAIVAEDAADQAQAFAVHTTPAATHEDTQTFSEHDIQTAVHEDGLHNHSAANVPLARTTR